MQNGHPVAPISGLGWLVVLWGLGGILALLAHAILRLTPIALEPVVDGMTWWEWCICAVWIVFNAYAEGHRGFHLRFSPRTVARAFHLARHPTTLHVVLAPAYCMSLFHATRRGRIVAWCLVVGIVILVVLIRMAPQPWRGIVDAGVVVGLLWGSVSILVHLSRAFRADPGPPVDLPEAAARAAQPAE